MQIKQHFLKIKGLAFCGLFAYISIYLSNFEFFLKYNLNSLTLAILLGMLISNLLAKFIPASLNDGVAFCGKNILRFAIVLYGFRISFNQIFAVGISGLLADLIIASSTFFIGYFLGRKLFNLDKDLCILTAIGSSICGAAAVLGTDSLLKAKPHKVSLAVATVVLFGTISMFLYPFIYKLGYINDNSFGIYIGSTVHEVAQVVAAAGAINHQTMDTAVIVKLTRVMLLVPFLFALSFYLTKEKSSKKTKLSLEKSFKSGKIQIPYFAVFFIVMCGVNSLNVIGQKAIGAIISFDVFLLTLAMFALGLQTNFAKIKNLGIKPILLALIMFIWLVVFGFFLAKVL